MKQWCLLVRGRSTPFRKYASFCALVSEVHAQRGSLLSTNLLLELAVTEAIFCKHNRLWLTIIFCYLLLPRL
jgi:hypothetical protein